MMSCPVESSRAIRPMRPTVWRRARSRWSYVSGSSYWARSRVAACCLRRTLMRLETRSPRTLSSSEDRRASPSPATAMPSSSATRPPRRDQSTPPPRARTRTPAPLVEASAQAPALTPRDSALHALNRLAYGPRPGEVDRVAADGVMRWVDRQLSPRKIDDGPLAARERRFKILDYDAGELARVYVDAQRERREQKRAAATDSMTEKPEQAGPLEQRGRRLGAEFQELAVIRAVLSERQLYEVMVDFWANHFNVFFAKGADRFLTPSYTEQTIRPRALGKFADLLIATAESPAMLFYLDNWESVAPGATPPQAMRLRARPLFGPRPMFGRPPLFDPGHDPMRADSLRRQALARVPKGINENYARELLELHTLGVDGGYTQQDVINVARIFTGWSVRRPQQGGDFEFHDWAHDYGEKVVMGVMFPAGHGRDEGVRLLTLLANYPATMHHVSRRLCQRFVNDDPPDGCVDDAVTAWKRSDGDIREVLRAIFRSPDFWAPESVRGKVKI